MFAKKCSIVELYSPNAPQQSIGLPNSVHLRSILIKAVKFVIAKYEYVLKSDRFDGLDLPLLSDDQISTEVLLV